MATLKRILWLTALLGLISGLHAQRFDPDKSIFWGEVDPLPYLMGGMGGHLGWTPQKSKHVSVGLSFIAGATFPEALVNRQVSGSEQQWGVCINQGMGLWGQYYLQEKNEGWFVGLQLFTQEMRLTHAAFPDETDDTNLVLIALQGGYVWYPFERINLYLRPWAGVGYQRVISGTFEPDRVDPDLIVGNREYELSALMPFATLHIGYALGR